MLTVKVPSPAVISRPDWLICPRDLGGLEAVRGLAELNGRFATVEDAKREKGDRWSGYRYML